MSISLPHAGSSFPTVYDVSHHPTAILYHHPCPDGFCASLIAWKWYNVPNPELSNTTVAYVPCRHGSPLPDVTGQHVAVFDMSWSLDEVRTLKQRNKSFILLDHHASAEEVLYREEGCYFNGSKSGATLAWDFFFPKQPIPDLVKYVEDRDLWKWTLPDSMAFNIAHETNEMDFVVWDKLFHPDAVKAQIEKGKVLITYRDATVNRIIHNAIPLVWNGFNIMAVNTGIYVSEVGSNLCDKDTCEVAVMYDFDGENQEWRVSLRSKKKEHQERLADCSFIATAYGGGGHVCAAGFKWKDSSIISLFSDRRIGLL